MYIFLEAYKLNQTYSALRTRTRAAKLAKPAITAIEAEGYEVPASTEKQAAAASSNTSTEAQAKAQQLKGEWMSWQVDSIVNWYVRPPVDSLRG